VNALSPSDLARMLAELTAEGGTQEPILELILSSVGDGVAITNATGSDLYFNAAARRILGIRGDETRIDVRTHGADLTYLHDFSPIPEDQLPLVRALRGEDTTDVQLFARSDALPDGALICLNSRPVRTADGRVVGGVAVFHDVGARKRAEEELRAANAKLNAWVAELERRAKVTMLMNEMADLLQSCRTMKEFYGVVSRFSGRIFENEPGSVFVVNSSRSMIEMVAEWGRSLRGEKAFAPDACWALRRGRLHRVGGEALGPDCDHAPGNHAGYTCIPMMGQGEALGILHVENPDDDAPSELGLGAAVAESRLRTIISVAEHIALALANLKLRETLRMQAVRDPLTGLYNRRYMEESLEREIARAARSGGSVAAIMVDVDHFKRFNDTFGHAAADMALRETAQTILSLLTTNDIACRFGGEELVVILPDTTAAEAESRAETIRLAIAAQQLRYRGTPLGAITASFGVAASPSHANSPEGLLRAADEALYRAKGEGRNRVCVKGQAETSRNSIPIIRPS
jgi:diguanylate cyclase (GGDEF)-like protein/PAS domain S-box-containing protein